MMTASNRTDPAVMVIVNVKAHISYGIGHGTYLYIGSTAPLGIPTVQLNQPQFIGIYYPEQEITNPRFLVSLKHPGTLDNLMSISRYFPKLPDCLDEKGKRKRSERLLWLSKVRIYSQSALDSRKNVRIYVPKAVDLQATYERSKRPGLIRALKVNNSEYLFLDFSGSVNVKAT